MNSAGLKKSFSEGSICPRILQETGAYSSMSRCLSRTGRGCGNASANAKHAIRNRLDALTSTSPTNDLKRPNEVLFERIALSDALTTLTELHKIVYSRKSSPAPSSEEGSAAPSSLGDSSGGDKTSTALHPQQSPTGQALSRRHPRDLPILTDSNPDCEASFIAGQSKCDSLDDLKELRGTNHVFRDEHLITPETSDSGTHTLRDPAAHRRTRRPTGRLVEIRQRCGGL